MSKHHIHRKGTVNPYQYSDWGYSDLSQNPRLLNEPDLWEAVEGDPPEGAVMYAEKTKAQQLEGTFFALVGQYAEELSDTEFASVMAGWAACTKAFELEGKTPDALVEKALRGAIGQVNLPVELEPIRQSLLDATAALFA